ncbi:MAG: permease prefix domain 1-containing protein [Gemmatimonas sp.]
MSILDGFASRLRLFFSQKTTEARFKSEIEFHIAMESDRLAREEGLDRGEARRRALVAFGGIEKHREDLRDGRGTAWIGSLSLDFKLGLRMLVKYPGLTLVGVLGMSVAVAIGALAFTTVATITGKSLPLDEGNRIITIESFDVKKQDVRRESLPADLLIWRLALRTVDDLSACEQTSSPCL